MPDPMKMLARHLWRDSLLPVVVDASALDWLPLDPVPKKALRVITPHPGEAARLLRRDSAAGAGQPAQRPAQCFAAIRQCLGGAQGPSNPHRPKLGRRLRESVRQSTPGAGRQRRRARRATSPDCWPNPICGPIRSRRFVTRCGSTAPPRMPCRPRGPTGWWRIWWRAMGAVKSSCSRGPLGCPTVPILLSLATAPSVIPNSHGAQIMSNRRFGGLRLAR